jgi:SAM-dependent methyltransferase
MNQPYDPTNFDSLAYWRARHEKYLHDPRGVGNVALDISENERIYEAVDAYIETLVKGLDLKSPIRVLELGCGTGMIAGAFIRSGCQYTGVDISEKAIEIAKERYPAGKFEVANIAKLPLIGYFDIIIERTVFIHLTEDVYWRSVIGEVKRLLAKDGIFIVMDNLPIDSSDAPRGATHVNFRLYKEYGEAFKEVNMKFDLSLRHSLAQKMSLSATTHLVTHT